MIIYNDKNKLFDFKNHGLNVGLLIFNDYRSVKEKIIKSSSDMFDDSYIFKTDKYDGYSTELVIAVRDNLIEPLITSLYEGNRISLPHEADKCRKYYVEGEIKIEHYRNGFKKITVPVYFLSFIYSVEETEKSNIQKGLIVDVENNATAHAEPVITIKGVGTLVFNVNGVRHILKNSQGGYTIVSESKNQNVYDLNGNYKNVTSGYGGTFPILKPGTNRVQLISGDSLDITFFRRWKF